MIIDVALSISSTVARIHTVTVVAGLCLWAVVVCLATDNNHRLSTGNSRVSEVTVRTGADGFVLLHLTECICCARICDGAGIETLSVDTGSVGRTLRVVRTFRRQYRDNVRSDLEALDLRISRVAYWTGAAGGMQPRFANCIGSTGIYITCIPTGSRYTLVWISAISVHTA